MALSARYRASANRVAHVCDTENNDRTLRVRVIDAVRDLVPFDAYAWLLTDPLTCVGSAPLADVPCLPELPELIRLKYLTPTNRWTSLADSPVALLHRTTDGDLTRSLVWRELLCRYDVVDVASVVFRDPFGCWGFLDLWRSSPQRPFDTDDARFLSDLTEPVTNALRAAQAQTFDHAEAGSERDGPVVLVCSPELQVRAQTPATTRYLQTLVPPAPEQPPVPAGAYNVAAQLLAAEAGVDDHAPSARVHFRQGRWLTLRAARIGGGDGEASGDIAVTIEDTTPADRADLYARAVGLTRREAELLGHLASGAGTSDAAQRMCVSEHTVQDHCKAIFAKTGTHSRRELLARALGH